MSVSLQPMRIGIDIRSTQNDSGVRGIGRYAYDVADGLSRYEPENEYCLFAYPDRPIPDRVRSLPGNCRIVPVPTALLDSTPRDGQEAWKLKLWWWLRCQANIYKNSRALSQAIRRERVDLIHLTNIFEGTFFTHGRYPCRVVKTVHDVIPLVLADLFVPHWPYRIRTLYQQEVKGVAYGTDWISAISKSAKDDAVRYLGVAPERVRVVYNGVGDSFVKETDPARLESVRQKYGIDGLFFLFCGGGGPNKNRERMVAAFCRHWNSIHETADNCQMIIAGPSAGDEASLAEIIAQNGLPADRLRILGFVPDADLVALLSNAIAVLMATLYEGFGLPAAQALQLGTPVIGANIGALPEVIEDAGLLVDPYSIEAIEHAMARLASDRNLRSELAARGPEQAAKFSLKRQAEGHIALYREALGWS